MEAKWFQSIVQLLHNNTRIGWTYWALNGSDRYGLLNANYDDIKDSGPQNALATIQFPLGIGLVSPGHSTATVVQPAAAAPVSTPAAAAGNQATGAIGCQVTYTNSRDWKTGFSAALIIRNTGPAPINGWQLTWTWDGTQKIDQLWNAHYTQNGPAIIVANETWNAVIPAAAISPAGELTGIGFNATYSGQNRNPTKFFLNGTLCK
jgi:endoglucanase